MVMLRAFEDWLARPISRRAQWLTGELAVAAVLYGLFCAGLQWAAGAL